MTKMLCVCSMGNVRSVTMARILKAKGHDVLAIGLKSNSRDTLRMLFGWADIVLVAENWMGGIVPHIKVRDLEIGKDVWNEAMHPELVRKVKRKLKEIGL